MLAVLAAIVFFLAAVDVGIGELNMLYFALALLALHFAIKIPVTFWRKRQ